MAHAARGSEGGESRRQYADNDLYNGLPSFFVLHGVFALKVSGENSGGSPARAKPPPLSLTRSGDSSAADNHPLSAARFALIAVGARVVGRSVVAAAVAAGVAAGAGAFLVLLGQQGVNEHELGLLQELAAGDVLLRSLLGQETDVQRLQVLVHVEVLLLQGSVLLVLEGAVEGAEALDLHLLRVEQHLQQTAAELLQHAVDHVGGVDASVFGDVLRQLARVERLQALDLSVPLAEGSAVGVLVLLHFIQNFCHSNVCVFNGVRFTLRPSASGGRHPAFRVALRPRRAHAVMSD